MSKEKITILIPTKDEAMEIIARVFKAQAAESLDTKNIRNLPVTIFQAWCGRMMLKAFDKMNNEYGKSANEFRAEVEKAVEGFEKEVMSVFERAV